MTSDLQSRLQQSLGEAYTLERELAGGGMSRVFVAEETALGRKVVIKVLPPDLAAGVSSERFTREVQLAARLQHPHIVPVHRTGAAGDLPYYTMPFVEGDTLRARILRGPIPIDEGIRILHDIARALEYAHQHGVVHRDIKPENIFLAGRSAVVSDFGIAKALTAARTVQGDAAARDSVTHLTAAGTAVGTPAYMSPEQAAGAPDVDHRSDIYSFGCVAYEILTGTPPFTSRVAHELILAQIAQTPPPLAATAPAVPPHLANLVMRCLAKAPHDRPRSATELVSALELVATTGPVQVPATRRGRVLRGLAAVGGLGVVAWLAALALGDRGTPVTPAGGTRAIAVIPFVNVGGDTATEYFSDGITDELATALGRISQLRVAARSGAYRYKGRRDVDVREVGRDLNVDLVLTGTARRTAQQLRVSAQLVSAVDGVEIWSQTFDRRFDDVLVLADSLTAEISEALSIRLGGTGIAAEASRPEQPAGTSDALAYDAYLRGKYSLLRRRFGLEGAAEEFSQAIARDPQFARAYAGLGSALALLTYFGDSQPPDRVARSREAARTALRLDSTNAEAHVALGILSLTLHRWRDAEQALERAIALEPGLADAHFHLGRALIYQGRLPEGVRSIELARSLEPFSPVLTVWLGHVLPWVGRPQQGLVEARRAWELDSNSMLVRNLGSLAFIQQGESAWAQRVARRRADAPFQRGTLSYVLARAGDPAEARRVLQSINERNGRSWFDQINLTLLNLALGDTAGALDAMERAVERGEPIGAFHALAAPVYDPVRASPRFAALVRRLELDPAILAAPRGGRTP
ncbi:MAG TPA: protein kinase [Gemmatimonadaceae bacterium]|nr:protein kinase [Gemmatimonadaceae bacterium]